MPRNGRIGATGIKKLNPEGNRKEKIEAKVRAEERKASGAATKVMDVEIMLNKQELCRFRLGLLRKPPRQLLHRLQFRQLNLRQPWPMQNGSLPSGSHFQI